MIADQLVKSSFDPLSLSVKTVIRVDIHVPFHIGCQTGDTTTLL